MICFDQMPGTTPIQDSFNHSVATIKNDSVDCVDLMLETNSKRSSLSSTCSSMSNDALSGVRRKWSLIEREVSHCVSEPTAPHPMHSDVAVRAYSSTTNSPHQVWVSEPPTPPTRDISPNTIRINLIQSPAEGRVIVEGDQVLHVRGTINPLISAGHVAQENSPPKKTTNIDDLTYQMKHPYSSECEITYVEEGDESIQEMLNKQVNYGNKMKYIDQSANRTNKMKNNSLEQEKKDKI